MRILVLGGDGYLGWPTALHLSESGHEVGIADNFVRRQYDHELGVRSLVPIEPLAVRVAAWHEVSGRRIGTYTGDLCDAEFTYATIREFAPDAVTPEAESSPVYAAAYRPLEATDGPRVQVWLRPLAIGGELLIDVCVGVGQ